MTTGLTTALVTTTTAERHTNATYPPQSGVGVHSSTGTLDVAGVLRNCVQGGTRTHVRGVHAQVACSCDGPCHVSRSSASVFTHPIYCRKFLCLNDSCEASNTLPLSQPPHEAIGQSSRIGFKRSFHEFTGVTGSSKEVGSIADRLEWP